MTGHGNVHDLTAEKARRSEHEKHEKSEQTNITQLSDDEIREVADQYWAHLVKTSNEGNYGEFARYFSHDLALAMNSVVVNHQFANSELARNLDEDFDFLGIIRRGEHVTVLYRQRCTVKEGEWLGRLVLGFENGRIRIFGASLF